jgi:hypothetical protein
MQGDDEKAEVLDPQCGSAAISKLSQFEPLSKQSGRSIINATAPVELDAASRNREQLLFGAALWHAGELAG